MTFSDCIIRQGPSCPSAGQPALPMSCWAPGRSHGLRTLQLFLSGGAGECATTRQADSARTRASTPRTARATTVVPAPRFPFAASAPTAGTAALGRHRTATFRRLLPRRTATRRLRPRRDPHRYAKPPLHLSAATTTLHVPTTSAAPGFRAAVAFVCLLEAFFVGVAGKRFALQVPLAAAQRAAPLGGGAVGMQTLAPARAMSFRCQRMNSTAALRPLMFLLLLGPRVTTLVLGAVAWDQRACQRACRRGSSA